MFEDLLDEISRFFWWRWPTTNGEISFVEIQRVNDDERVRLCVSYKFYVGVDGPYIGEGYWYPAFSYKLSLRVREAKRRLKLGLPVRVRYRPNDPSINRLSGSVASYLKKT